MKRYIILFSVLFNIFVFGITAKAEETTYQNVITDDTSIEEDFKILSMDIDNYYMPQSYDYAKFYVVAMAESYIDTETIQTYFYIYNPKTCSGIEINELYYTLNSASNHQTVNAVFDFNTHGLYKVKGFKYSYAASANIKITKLDGAYIPAKATTQSLNYLAALPPIGVERIELSSESDFEATVSHNISDNTLSVELNYDSTLVIDEYEACKIVIPPDDSFMSIWSEFWDIEEKELYLHFYNFNFPNNIKPDKILYARFKYDFCHYQDEYVRQLDYSIKHTRTEISRENEEKEYIPETCTFKSNNYSKELNFEVFVLGNRITKGEFDYITEFTDEQKKAFDFDCSILLDSTIYTLNYRITATTVHDFELENIEFIELDYEKDGVIYKCQIVNEPLNDEEDLGKPFVKTFWQAFYIFLVKFGGWIFEKVFHITNVPKIFKAVLGGVSLFIIFIIILLILFKWIPKLIASILSLIFKRN